MNNASVAGEAAGSAESRPPNHPSQLRSPRRGMCAAVLAFEAVLMLMLAPVLITIANVAVPRALTISAVIAGSCLLLAGSLRREWAYLGGWLVQLALIGLGVLVPTMFAVGAIFAVLWAAAYWLGKKIERERAAAYAAHAARDSA